MTRLKVLFLTAWYPTGEQPVGGVFVREHAKAVRGYDDVVVVHLAGLDHESRKPWRIEQDADEEITAGIPTYRVYHGRPLPKTGFVLFLASAWAAHRRVVADGFRPDVIHAHVYSAGIPSVLIGKLERLPVVVTEHWTAFPRRRIRGRALLFARLVFQLADVVAPVSQGLRAAIEAHGLRGRFEVVPNVVDLELFYPPEQARSAGGSKLLLYVGGLDRRGTKGVPDLIDAMARLAEMRDDWTLHIVGDGPARVDHERSVFDRGLADRISFHGALAKSGVAAMMRRADLLVIPSRVETFCVVAAEALASGLPVVATRCGGPEYLIPPGSGLLVEPGNVEELASAIHEALSKNAEDWQPALGLVRSQLSPEAVGARLHAIYERLVARRPHAAQPGPLVPRR